MTSRLGYVRLQLYGIEPELRLFKAVTGLDILVVTGKEDSEEGESIHANRIELPIVRHPVDFVLGTFFRATPSPIRMLTLRDIEDIMRRIDLVSTVETYSYLSLNLSRVASKTGIPVVTSVWETIPEHPIHRIPPYSRCVTGVLKMTTLFIAYTNKARAYLIQIGAAEEKVRVVYPGIDLDAFRPRGRASRDNDRTRILYVGRLDEEKGLRELLLAFQMICHHRQDVELWIRAKVRSGRVGTLLRELSRRLPVRLVGPMPYDELPSLYRDCDIFCMPSKDRFQYGFKVWEEQFGQALLEAMACGLPVVATDCGAIPEVLGNRNILVAQGSSRSLADGLGVFIEDTSERKRAGAENRKRATELYSLSTQARELGKILSAATESNR